MHTENATDKSERLARWVFGILTVLFIGFILYASWTPADGKGHVMDLVRGLLHPRRLFAGHNLRDIATNVLLYMPLGIFLALAVCAKGDRKPSLFSPWLFFGFIVSLTMEVGQSFIGRTPDLVDVITNSTGHALGYLIVILAVRVYGLSPLVFMGLDPNNSQDKKTQSIAAFRFIAICVYVLIALLPFDVSVQLGKVYAQLLPDETGVPRLILDPLYSVSHWKEHGLKLTFELWALLPLGALTAFLAGIRGKLNIFRPIFSCVTVAFLCETAQIFILSRRTDVAMVPVAVLAGALGWLLVRSWFRLQSIDPSNGAQRDDIRWQELALALAGYSFIIGLFAWSPFQFETDIGAVLNKIRHDSNLVPFRQHFSTRSLASAVDIVKETGLFIPFGILCARLILEVRPSFDRIKTLLVVAVVSGSFAVFMELSQAVCIGRTIDITDAFLGGFGGLCGAVLLQLFHVRGPQQTEEVLAPALANLAPPPIQPPPAPPSSQPPQFPGA